MSEGIQTLTPKIDVDAAIDHAVGELRQSDIAIDEMRKKYLKMKVGGIDDEQGLQIVTEARKDIKKLRCAIDNRGKELRADATRFGKSVLDEVKRLKGEIAPIENHLIEQENSVQREKDRIAAEAEKARQKKIQARVNRLNAAKCRVEHQLIQLMDDDEFEEYFALEEAEVLRVEREQEAERQRLEVERRELEAERKKLQIEREAEQEKLAAEREAIRIERETEQKKLDTERAKLAEEQKAEEARRQALREKQDAERQQLEQRQRDELARLQKIEDDQLKAEHAELKQIQEREAEQARLKREAELKPIREQLETTAQNVTAVSILVPVSLADYSARIKVILSGAAQQIRELAE